MDEGEHFYGETLADSAGYFTFDLRDMNAFGVFTSTATVEGSGTSGFSSPLAVPLSITSSTLPEGWVGIAYSETLSAIGGVPPYVWSHLAGSMPSGLSIASEGIVYGTPEESDTSEFMVLVSDDAESTDVQTLTLTIHSCLKGDVDGDGAVDITDVLRVVTLMLRFGDPPTQFEECAADCNGDNRVDILDVVGILNVILGKGTCQP